MLDVVRGFGLVNDSLARPVWWSMPEAELLKLLRRAHAGEDPEALYAEIYANAGRETVEPEEGPLDL